MFVQLNRWSSPVCPKYRIRYDEKLSYPPPICRSLSPCINGCVKLERIPITNYLFPFLAAGRRKWFRIHPIYCATHNTQGILLLPSRWASHNSHEKGSREKIWISLSVTFYAWEATLEKLKHYNLHFHNSRCLRYENTFPICLVNFRF